jgi:hypothetical protein
MIYPSIIHGTLPSFIKSIFTSKKEESPTPKNNSNIHTTDFSIKEEINGFACTVLRPVKNLDDTLKHNASVYEKSLEKRFYKLAKQYTNKDISAQQQKLIRLELGMKVAELLRKGKPVIYIKTMMQASSMFSVSTVALIITLGVTLFSISGCKNSDGPTTIGSDIASFTYKKEIDGVRYIHGIHVTSNPFRYDQNYWPFSIPNSMNTKENFFLVQTCGYI